MSEAQQELSEENTKENNQKLNKHESSATSDKTVQIQTVQIMPLHWTLKLSLRVPKFFHKHTISPLMSIFSLTPI